MKSLAFSFMVLTLLASGAAMGATCGAKDPDDSIAGCTGDIVRYRPQRDTRPDLLASAYQRRAIAYENKNMMKEAWADYDSSVELTPNFITYYNRGQFHAEYGDPNRAIADLGEAIARHEQATPQAQRQQQDLYVKALFHRGESLRRADRNAEALTDYSKAIALEKDAVMLYSRALAASRVGQHDLAIADLTEVLAMRARRGTDVGALSNRGMAYLRKGDFPKAFADLDEVIRREPDSAMAYVRRGDAFERAGQRDKAVADYRHAMSLSASLREAHDAIKRLNAQ